MWRMRLESARLALKTERESERFEIDNTPRRGRPSVGGFRKNDGGILRPSRPATLLSIDRATVQLDGGDWILGGPELASATRLSSSINSACRAPGEHTIAFAPNDRSKMSAAQNHASAFRPLNLAERWTLVGVAGAAPLSSISTFHVIFIDY